MADTFISHLGDVLKYVKEYWHVLVGTLATLYGASKMVKRNWLQGYATKREVSECHSDLSARIRENAREIQKAREQNTLEHNEIRDIIIRHMDK